MSRRVQYACLPTEQRHPRSRALDLLPLDALVSLMHHEDLRAVRAVGRQRTQIVRAIRLMARALRHGGRMFFLGAGTSGRLGVIEATECPPTFNTHPSQVQAIIAGGRRAVFSSQEGTEDNRAAARRVVRQRIRPGDVVVGIAASGITPFVMEGLRAAARRGAKTLLLTCHPHPTTPARIRITLNVGPEVLTGSTRLKAATATKLVLNMLTLGAMVHLGKTYGNLMVDVRPTSRKLRARALRIIRTFTGGSEPAAARALLAAHGHTKAAILMALRECSYRTAQRQLVRAHGSLRLALELRG